MGYIVGLSGVRKNGEELIGRKNDSYLYYYGETKGQKGFGFYINGKTRSNVRVLRKVSEGIRIIMKVNIDGNKHMSTIQVYAPTLESKEEDIKKLYSGLQEATSEEGEQYNMVMGDWNAKVGHNYNKKDCIGQYGLGKRNMNGEMLLEYARSNNLKVAGTFFKKTLNRKWGKIRME